MGGIMSLILQGSTSGSVTLQEPAVAGTTVLTLPAVSGTVLTTGSSGQSIPKAALPTGSVLQVVSTYYGTTSSTTSGTYVDTGLSASITPTSATSKILVMVTHGTPIKGNATTDISMRLVRGSTSIWEFGSDMLNVGTVASNYGTTATIQYLDSPATTSSTTYKTQFLNGQNSGFTVYAHIAGSSMTLMEIAA